jgi:hypothetical protein
LQHRVGVQVIVHVQLLHGSSRLFFRGVRHRGLSQRSGVSLTVSGDFLYAPDDITVLGAYLLQLLLVYMVGELFDENTLELSCRIRTHHGHLVLLLGVLCSLFSEVRYSEFAHVEVLAVKSVDGGNSVVWLSKLNIGKLSEG